MFGNLRFPIRLKIMIALLFTVTATVSLITFTMARFFHEDKQAYVNDWVSIAAVTTAEDCNTILLSYARRLRTFARVLLNQNVPRADKSAMMEGFFEDLPELIDITLIVGGKEVNTASDQLVLRNAGIDLPQLAEFRATHVIPAERILGGEIYVRNTTLREELPWFTLAFTADGSVDGEPVIISALLSLDELIRLGSQFEVFEVLLVDSEGTLMVHPQLSRVARRQAGDLHPAASSVHESTQIGRTVEFEREDTEMIGGFAAVPFGGLTVAAHIPKAAAYLASRDLLARMLWVALIVLVLCAVAGRLWARRVTRPVERLSAATRKIAKGSFDIAVDVRSRDEIGALAGSFNTMARELKDRDEELSTAHSQLVQSEKMGAFGQISAGIAHEVKNPLAGILGCAQLSLMDVDEGSMLYTNLRLIERETERCRTIIDNLMKFARKDKTELEPTEINRVVRDAAAIVNHQLEINRVHLNQELEGDLPPVLGNANQLQQVLMNLMINAQQAMEGGEGSVTVSTRRSGEAQVEIVVSDDGPGIPEEIQQKIFEPFFTTKTTGKGTGLGLSVSFGIIHDHSGEIALASEPGQGTEFTIRFPVLAEEAEARVVN